MSGMRLQINCGVPLYLFVKKTGLMETLLTAKKGA